MSIDVARFWASATVIGTALAAPSAQTTISVAHYSDAVTGVAGWLATDGTGHRLAAGGLRMAKGTDEALVVELARNMTRKQQLLGLAVDGAKAGLDCDPSAPQSVEVLARFIAFLRPYLSDRLSLGPDRGTTWSALRSAAQAQGLASTKVAVAGAQGLDPTDVARRLDLLDALAGPLTLGERRAGHALAVAALAAHRFVGGNGCRVALQGFGTLGRAVAVSLDEHGAQLVAVGDEVGCVRARHSGIDVQALLDAALVRRLRSPAGCRLFPPGHLVTTDADVMVLAGGEDALDMGAAAALRAKVVAVGANLGLSPRVEAFLGRRGVLVVPDFVGGCGGSASMNELFGPPEAPSAAEVLERTGATLGTLVNGLLGDAARRGISSRTAALALCAQRRAPAGVAPYRTVPVTELPRRSDRRPRQAAAVGRPDDRLV